MAAYEVLLLNTAIPQIQAAQAGDTYVVPRDIAFSAALTLSAGTANGVPYLNGSKVLTTGSALTFDGTILNNTGAASGIRATLTGGLSYSTMAFDGVYATGTDLYLFAPTGKFVSIYASNAEQVRVTSTGLKSSIAGTNADPAFSYTSDTNTGIFFPAADKLGFTAGGGADQMVLTTTGLGIGTSSPQSGGITVFAGTAVAATTPGVMTLGPNSTTVESGEVIGRIQFYSNDASTSSAGVVGKIDCIATGNFVGTAPTALTFHTNDSVAGTITERARITSGGYFKASNTGTYQDATGLYHELRSNSSDINTLFVGNTSASPYGQVIRFASASPDNNTNWFFTCEDSTTTRMYVYSDGDLANHDGVYGTISDQKLKQDIVDAGSQWDDIKAIRFRKYRMKSDVAANPDAPALLGVVAQELEQVSPGLVDEHPDMETVEVTDEDGNVTQTQQPTGTTTKTVKSSILLMKAAVALQEAMARIEKLEAEVAALKGA